MKVLIPQSNLQPWEDENQGINESLPVSREMSLRYAPPGFLEDPSGIEFQLPKS